jgi:hypothetical protein
MSADNSGCGAFTVRPRKSVRRTGIAAQGQDDAVEAHEAALGVEQHLAGAVGEGQGGVLQGGASDGVGVDARVDDGKGCRRRLRDPAAGRAPRFPRCRVTGAPAARLRPRPAWREGRELRAAESATRSTAGRHRHRPGRRPAPSLPAGVGREQQQAGGVAVMPAAVAPRSARTSMPDGAGQSGRQCRERGITGARLTSNRAEGR